MAEAQDLSAIVAAAMAASADPYVLYEADFPNGTTMTGSVAFLIYTRLLDELGISYESVFEDDGSPEWDFTRQERTFSEATSLLTFSKQFTSQGVVRLSAGEGIVSGTEGVAVVAGTASLEAGDAITGLKMAVNTIEDASSAGRDSIDIEDVDGYGELTPGLELKNTEGGGISVTAENGFVVDHVTSHGASNTVALTSVNYNLFVRESGGSIHADGEIVLDAAGDLVVQDNLIAAERITLNAGGYLSTFEKQVTLDAPALTVSAGGSVNLMGHIDGLSSLDVESTGNVNFLNGGDGVAGFNVFVQAVADQQSLMQDLDANLRSQAQITALIGKLETALAESEAGGQEVLDGLSSVLLQDLMTLPLDVQSRQVVEQYQAFRGLLDVQSTLPDKMEEMTLDLGDGIVLTYGELVGQMTQVGGEIEGLQRNLAAVEGQIENVSADELGTQLQSVRTTLGEQETYLQSISDLLVTVGSAIYARGGSVPDMIGDEAPADLNPAWLASVDLSAYTDTELLNLYGDILAVQASVEGQVGTLRQLESQVLGQMADKPDTLAWVNRQLNLIDTAPAELQDLQARIGGLSEAQATIQNMLEYGQGFPEPPVQYYGQIDADLRTLQPYLDAISPTLQPLVSNLLTRQPYYSVQNELSAVYYEIYRTDQALSMVVPLIGEIDDVALDTGLRALEDYLDVLSESMQSIIQQLVKFPPLAEVGGQLVRLQEALGIVNGLLDETDPVVIDAGLRTLAGYEDVLSENMRGMLGNLQELAPTKLSTQETDLNTVNGVIPWRQEVGDLDEFPVDKLIGQLEGALLERFKIDPNNYVPLPRAYYEYNAKRGGATVVFEGGDPWILVANMNIELFYSRYVTADDLLNFWVGLQDGKDLLDNPPPSKIYGSGYGNGQIDELLLAGLTNLTLDQLYVVRAAIEDEINETTSLVLSIQKQLPAEKEYLEGQLSEWQDHLDLLNQARSKLPAEKEYLESRLNTLAAQQSSLQVALTEIEGILGQAWPTLSDENTFLEGQIATLSSQYSTLYSDYLSALRQEDELLQTKDDLVIQLDGLNNQRGTILGNLGTKQDEFGQLQGYENQMAVNLAGIIQQKWDDRYGLADVTLPTQEIEADILRVAEDLRHSQGKVSLGGTIDILRGRLESAATELEQLRSQLTTLQAEETSLKAQLAAAKEAVEEPTSIRITALGMSGGVDQQGGTTVDFNSNGFGFEQQPNDGRRVAQDPASGFYLYEYKDDDTGEYFYREVKGMSTDQYGQPQYIEDNADDTFYVWPVAMEQSGGTWYYRDVAETPDDSGDDVLYAWQGGEVPEKLYPIDSTFVVRRYRDTTTETRYEKRLDEDGVEETVTVTVNSDRFYINDYRYRLLASAVTETGEPDLENGDLYVLDTENGTVVDLETILDDEDVSLDDAIVLMPGQTLDDLNIDELGKNDILIRFSEFTPVFTPLSASEFTFVDPEDYSGTVVEELPTLFTELIHDGKLVVPVEEVMDGNVNLGGLSLSAVANLTILAAEGINGLDFGEAFSANSVSIQSTEDLHIGSKLLGGDMVEIHTTGDLFFDDGAVVEADTVNLQASNLTSDVNSLIVADIVHVVSAGTVRLYGDVAEYIVDVWDAGDIWINDVGTAGTKSFSHLITPAGDVTVLAVSTVVAGDMGADNIAIVVGGDGGIQLAGTLETYNSTVLLDAARAVVSVDGTSPSVIAEDVYVSAGLDVTVDPRVWGGEAVIDANMSVLIGAGYTGPLDLEVARDIIIDTEIVTEQPVHFSAANIIFTENGAIRNLSGEIVLNAADSLVFPGSTTRSTLDIPTIEGSDIAITTGRVEGSEEVLITGDLLSIVSGEGFALRTAVQSLEAEIQGLGDLRIDSLTSIELAGVSVFDGDLEVVSPGNIVATSATIETDRFSNKLTLLAGGTLSLDTVTVGQMVEIEVAGDAGTSAAGTSLVVTPVDLNDAVYPLEEAYFQVLVRDPSRSFNPVDGMVDLLIDFGDGTEPELITVPYIEPEPEPWGEPSMTVEGSPNFAAIGNSITSGDFDGDELNDVTLGDTGEHVACAGDVNGDGFDDLLTSTPDKIVELARTVVKADGTVDIEYYQVRGEVVLQLGSPYGLSEPVWASYGFHEYDQYGTRISTAGDVNGDGFDDILIGSPRGVEQTGIVQLFLGGEGGLSSEAVWTYEAETHSGRFGTGLAAVGDVDGDGFDDVMITAPFEDGTAGANAGRVYLFRGSAVSGLHEEPELVLEGDEAGMVFGFSIAALGDLNDDGYGDVAVSAPGYQDPEGGSGAVYVFFGQENGISTSPRLIPPKPESVGFGWQVAAAGDVNGDGFDDLLIGDALPVDPNPLGRVFLRFGSVSGLSTLEVELISGISIPTMDGARPIAGIGDWNGDGMSEIIIGDPLGGDGEYGAVYVFEGRVNDYEAPVIALADGIVHTYAEYGTYTMSVSVPEVEDGTPVGSIRVVVQGSPLPQDDEAFTDEGTTATILVSNLLSNDLDPDAGDFLSFTGIDTTGTIGTATDIGDGILWYDPAGQFEYLREGQSATDSFTYEVVDGHGDGGTATVVVTVYGVNDQPTALELSGAAVAENLPIGALVGTFSTVDPDLGDSFTYELVEGTGDTDNDKFKIDGDTLTTLATFDRETQKTYTIRVRSTDSGGFDVEKAVIITIENVNESPTAVDDPDVPSDPAYATDNRTVLVVAGPGVLSNDFDPDLDSELEAVPFTGTTAEGATVTLAADGSFTYDPGTAFDDLGPGQTRTDTFTYTVTDGLGGFDDATVTITVEGAATGLPGDLNGDGLVGAADLDIVRGHWGQQVPAGSLTQGDPSGDGIVGAADLDIVRANWGSTVTVAIPGDLNGDGRVTSGDLDIIRAHWGQTVPAGSLADGDASGDGKVGSADLDIVRGNWGNSAPSTAGDIDGDGKVAAADLSIVAANWGASAPAGGSIDGDVTGDGVVDSADLDLVRSNWNSAPKPSAAALSDAALENWNAAEAAWADAVEALGQENQTQPKTAKRRNVVDLVLERLLDGDE